MEHEVVAGVERLVDALRASAPPRVRVELEPASAGDLGWSSAADPAAWRLTLWTASGASRALGLLPRVGVLRAGERGVGFRPELVAVGPELLVVAAAPQEVALTADAVDRAGPLLARACAPIEAWAARVPVDDLALPGARRILRAPHALWIELEPDASELGLASLDALGVGAVVQRRAAADGSLSAPVVIARR